MEPKKLKQSLTQRTQAEGITLPEFRIRWKTVVIKKSMTMPSK